MQQNVMTMNERTILDTVQRWRRSKYSARPCALTILAISLITLLAWAKELRGAGAGAAPAGAGTSLRKRELTALDVEVGQHSTHNRGRICSNY
jgi:sodium/potassium/calcium exchanger 6